MVNSNRIKEAENNFKRYMEDESYSYEIEEAKEQLKNSE